MANKHPFNSPEDVSAPEERAVPSHPEMRTIVNPGMLVGTWVNVDPATRGITKIVIGWGAGHLGVHAYGACTPTPCDWGGVPAIGYGDNVGSPVANTFSAVYNVPFKDTILCGSMQRNLLVVDSYHHFKDGSGRSDYHSREVFHR